MSTSKRLQKGVGFPAQPIFDSRVVAFSREICYAGTSKGGMAMTLGQRISQYRKSLGISQEELGARLGVSRQAVSKWETGVSQS